MIIQLDDYFIRVLQKSGYELDYNKLVKINEKAITKWVQWISIKKNYFKAEKSK